MFGINGGELLILLLVAAVVVGPERLPSYAEQLAGWVRRLRDLARDTKERVDVELGEADVDWAALDPRRYDPRRIVREALLDDAPPHTPSRPAVPRPGRVRTAAAAAPAGAFAGPVAAAADAPAPFDDEAT
ncbi:Sec-independent protein translocase TatB [Cellulomonas xiejunii]|uniref:Sec-independent protein translocase TatB n=1 Tax=Cellulomonas xiejunii TaxID=2968083 RepID=A0ABY5KQR8_9CELL|nr:Sec-independent protein translocase TatB [Cellulomonas xiejunii]MCC2314473.1 Sec-independent protein translocase TatB [Cellulomonas xiejunii]MCC2322811.1 Sec-independent protein translocase TatB [Cellulomonas xiejunii]UUI72837.1 Sec-independent protein translocase TatB [Cellulomonas xiejunii]